MSDLAALISPASIARSGDVGSTASPIQSAQTTPATPLATAQDGALPGQTTPDSQEKPGFQVLLARQIALPAAAMGADLALANPIATRQPIVGTTPVQPDDQTAMALMLANAGLPATAPSGKSVPATGKMLPDAAKAKTAAASPADGASDTSEISPTTLALAGAMASIAQIFMPAVATPNTPADPAMPASATSASPVALVGNGPSDQGKVKGQDNANAATAPQPQPQPQPAPSGTSGPPALLITPLDPASSALAAVVSARITLAAPDEATPATATPVAAITPRSTRLRPVLAGTRAASAQPEIPAPGPFESPAAIATSLSAKSSDDANAQDLPTPPILSLASASTGQPAHPLGAPDGAATPSANAQPASHIGTDFAALVDRLVEARAAARSGASPQVVQASISHVQFGRVGLRFEQGGDGLSVSMTSADPEFTRTAQAALAAQPAVVGAGAAAAANDGASMGSSGQQPGNPSSPSAWAQGSATQSGFAGANSGSSGRNPDAQPRATPRDFARADRSPAPASDPATRDGSGILA